MTEKVIDVVSNLNALAAPILKEFKTLENEDVLEILNQYYNLDLEPIRKSFCSKGKACAC